MITQSTALLVGTSLQREIEKCHFFLNCKVNTEFRKNTSVLESGSCLFWESKLSGSLPPVTSKTWSFGKIVLQGMHLISWYQESESENLAGRKYIWGERQKQSIHSQHINPFPTNLLAIFVNVNSTSMHVSSLSQWCKRSLSSISEPVLCYVVLCVHTTSHHNDFLADLHCTVSWSMSSIKWPEGARRSVKWDPFSRIRIASPYKQKNQLVTL